LLKISVRGPKKTRDQIQQELYIRKRSRKSVKSVLELDIDGLPFEPSDDSSSGEETFLVATSRQKHKAGKRKSIIEGIYLFFLSLHRSPYNLILQTPSPPYIHPSIHPYIHIPCGNFEGKPQRPKIFFFL
jgi:hypothetical protein